MYIRFRKKGETFSVYFRPKRQKTKKSGKRHGLFGSQAKHENSALKALEEDLNLCEVTGKVSEDRSIDE